MSGTIENIIENIDFSMKMEDMPLTEEDKTRLRICLSAMPMLMLISTPILWTCAEMKIITSLTSPLIHFVILSSSLRQKL